MSHKDIYRCSYEYYLEQPKKQKANQMWLTGNQNLIHTMECKDAC